MTEIKKFMLIKNDADENNNKFWEAILHDDDRVFCRWGRVGANGQSKWFNGGQSYIDKKIASKKKKGYREARVTAHTGGTTSTVASSSLKKIAKKQIKASCAVTQKLIDFLVQQNAHQITTQSGGKLNVDIASGQIQLPSGMGVLTADAIDDARDLLDEVNKLKAPSKRSSRDFKNKVQDYLMLVPQVVPRQRGWIEHVFVSDQDISSQIDLLDSLEATLKAISTDDSKDSTPEEKVFDAQLAVIDDKKVRKHIEKLYQHTRKRMHSSYKLKPQTIYSVNINVVANAFEKGGKKLGNVKELWHGTKAANLLSILKSGLIIPKSGGTIHVTGRLYGNGVYFSDQSTKALNYATGYWGGGGSAKAFMFLADVAMGKTFTPRGHGNRYYGSRSYPVSGYDSTFAEGGSSGVANNEMIVYKTNQCNLKFLVEFA